MKTPIIPIPVDKVPAPIKSLLFVVVLIYSICQLLAQECKTARHKAIPSGARREGS